MWWKRKSELQPKEENDNPTGKLSSGIKQYVLQKETNLAGYLNRKTQGLSRRGQLVFLVVFCTLFGGGSLYLVLNTFWGQNSSATSITPKSINVPKHSNRTGEEKIYPGILVTEEDMKQVRAFRLYMDSLRMSARGKQIYDSILGARPGILDTVSMLEQLYLHQQNK